MSEFNGIYSHLGLDWSPSRAMSWSYRGHTICTIPGFTLVPWPLCIC